MYRILTVDDDPMILEDNKTYFSAKGYEVVCADTAQAAEKIILSNTLDCVILDVDLPDMSGFTLCENIRAKTGLPIVFLSGYTEEENRIHRRRRLCMQTLQLKGAGASGAGPHPFRQGRGASQNAYLRFAFHLPFLLQR